MGDSSGRGTHGVDNPKCWHLPCSRHISSFHSAWRGGHRDTVIHLVGKCKSKRTRPVKEKRFNKELSEQLRKAPGPPPLPWEAGVHPPQGRSVVVSLLISTTPAHGAAAHAMGIPTWEPSSVPALECQHHTAASPPPCLPAPGQPQGSLHHLKPAAASPSSLPGPHHHRPMEGP